MGIAINPSFSTADNIELILQAIKSLFFIKRSAMPIKAVFGLMR